jgi:hypothetical protein
MTGDQTYSILKHIAAAYPRFEITEQRLEVWHEYLQNMPYEQVLAKVKHHIASEKFPPSIAEISVQPRQKNEFLEELKEWERDAKYNPKH